MHLTEVTDNPYRNMIVNLTETVGNFLRGRTHGAMGFDPDTPVVLNQAQRHSAWEMKHVIGLSRTLFDGLLYSPATRLRALADTQPGGAPLYDGEVPEKIPPYLNPVEVWCADKPSQQRKGAHIHPIQILDGQQRSFSLRAMTLWMLAKKANMTGDMDPILLDVLMRKDGRNWTQRVDYDLGENAAGTWTNDDGTQGGALHHLLSTLVGGTRSDAKAVATQIQSRLDRDLKPAAAHSTQATLILRVFKQMDTVWQQLEEIAPEATPISRINAIAKCMLHASLSVSLPSPHMNPELRVQNHNTNGVHFSETETIRSYLVVKARHDPSVAGATHKLEADALALGKQNAHELERLSYCVAMAMASGKLAPLSVPGGNGSGTVTKDLLAELLNTAPDPEVMAQEIARHLPAALNAVCLAKTGRLPPGATTNLPKDVQDLLVRNAALEARGMVAASAWMAMAAPDLVRKTLPFVNLATASNFAVALLTKIKAENTIRFGRQGSITNALDIRVATWVRQIETAENAMSMGPQVLFEILNTGDPSYAAAPVQDMIDLFRCLDEPKYRKKFSDLVVGKKDLVLAGKTAGKTAGVFCTLLNLSEADIAAGVELVNDKKTFCLFPRPLKNMLDLKPSALKIDISTTGVKRLNKTRKDILADFGGGKMVPTSETFLEKLVTAKRLRAREGDIRRLAEIAIGYWTSKGVSIANKKAQLNNLQSKAKQLAMGIRSTAQWNKVVSDRGLVDKVYNNDYHLLNEAEQKTAIKAVITGWRARKDKADAKPATPKPRRMTA